MSDVHFIHGPLGAFNYDISYSNRKGQHVHPKALAAHMQRNIENPLASFEHAA